MEVTSFVSAVAATIGAALAGVTVYISGRRDESKWRRDVLLETCEAFLNASFETISAGRQLARIEAPVDAVISMDAALRIAAAYQDKLSLMTRLRLLASEEVLRAAEDVHYADIRFIKAMSTVPDTQPSPAVSAQEFEAAKAEVHRVQGIFIAETRTLLNVRGRTLRVRNISQPRD